MRFDIAGGLESDHMLLRIKVRIAAFIPKKRREENSQERGNAEPTEEIPRKKRIRIDWKKLNDDSQLKERVNEKLDALILEKGLSTMAASILPLRTLMKTSHYGTFRVLQP
jgi:hypothetical protein